VSVRRLAAVAHWDPDGLAGPHVVRLLGQLAEVCDDVVLVTTSPLQPQARDLVTPLADLVERENVGQDFLGWKTVLDERLDRGVDEVVLTNDTYVGLLRHPRRMLADMADRPVEYWGVTASQQIVPHLQSFFLVLRSPVLRSRTFTEFWRRLRPAASRTEAIRSQELGISRALDAAGFASAPYFEPTADDLALADRRDAWYRRRRRALDLEAGRVASSVPLLPTPYNPAVSFADAALDDGRLPLVKFDTLRYDPYYLGSGHLLALGEELYPEMFEGIREYLARTDAAYPLRPVEARGGAHLTPQEQESVGYHLRRAVEPRA